MTDKQAEVEIIMLPFNKARAKALWSLSQAIATTRARLAFGKASRNVFANAIADPSVCAATTNKTNWPLNKRFKADHRTCI
jgi:hypothetical protein